jgi:hypothetical protein
VFLPALAGWALDAPSSRKYDTSGMWRLNAASMRFSTDFIWANTSTRCCRPSSCSSSCSSAARGPRTGTRELHDYRSHMRPGGLTRSADAAFAEEVAAKRISSEQR